MFFFLSFVVVGGGRCGDQQAKRKNLDKGMTGMGLEAAGVSGGTSGGSRGNKQEGSQLVCRRRYLRW